MIDGRRDCVSPEIPPCWSLLPPEIQPAFRSFFSSVWFYSLWFLLFIISHTVTWTHTFGIRVICIGKAIELWKIWLATICWQVADRSFGKCLLPGHRGQANGSDPRFSHLGNGNNSWVAVSAFSSPDPCPLLCFLWSFRWLSIHLIFGSLHSTFYQIPRILFLDHSKLITNSLKSLKCDKKWK